MKKCKSGFLDFLTSYPIESSKEQTRIRFSGFHNRLTSWFQHGPNRIWIFKFHNRLTGCFQQVRYWKRHTDFSLSGYSVLVQWATIRETTFLLIRSGIPIKFWKTILKFGKLLDLYYTHLFLFGLKISILNHFGIKTFQ